MYEGLIPHFQLQELSSVRVEVVFQYLHILKHINPLYSNIEIDEKKNNDDINYRYENLLENRKNELDLSKIKSTNIRKQVDYTMSQFYECNKKKIWPQRTNIYCFNCCHSFDHTPAALPFRYQNGIFHVYGCFCSPECATAYLMDENIDSSSKFERYHLINHIYSKIYDYKKNIKPAPNPYYMLEKYYGNLSIQEYRSLLRNERLFLIVDKPLTRILPELHEDNDDFIINNKIIPSNSYQIKKKLQKKQTKSNILSERFGLAQ